MGSIDLASAVLPLAGVAIGTTGALIGQFLTARFASRTEAQRIWAERRAERKESIMKFLDAAQDVELLLDETREDRPLAAPAARERLHRLWLEKKRVELVCSTQFAQAAHNYARVLNTFARDERINRHSDVDADFRTRVMELARTELGISAEPIERRIPMPENAYLDQGDA